MRNIGWSVALIFEIVFGLIGTLFTAAGVLLWIFMADIAASPNSSGDVTILPWIFGGIGIVFLLVFAILYFITARQRSIRRQLIAKGDYIKARVTDVQRNYYVRINHRHPYYLVCEGTNPYTGERLTFKSPNMMENPSQLLGQQLRVYLDYQNPKNYTIEQTEESF